MPFPQPKSITELSVDTRSLAVNQSRTLFTLAFPNLIKHFNQQVQDHFTSQYSHNDTQQTETRCGKKRLQTVTNVQGGPAKVTTYIFADSV